jgi:hypothetical protein
VSINGRTTADEGQSQGAHSTARECARNDYSMREAIENVAGGEWVIRSHQYSRGRASFVIE